MFVTVTIRGKRIGPSELESIRETLQQHLGSSRTQLSRIVCRRLSWHQPNGLPQDIACREILRRLEEMGLVQIPRPQHDGNNKRKLKGSELLQQEWDFQGLNMEGVLGSGQKIELERVSS